MDVKSLVLEKDMIIKKSLLVEKFLVVENFLDQEKILACGKIFACGKILWWGKKIPCGNLSCWRKNFCLWKTFLVYRKIPWWIKNICFWKTSLMKEKSFIVEKFFDREKMVSLSLENEVNKTNFIVWNIKISISKSRAKTLPDFLR